MLKSIILPTPRFWRGVALCALIGLTIALLPVLRVRILSETLTATNIVGTSTITTPSYVISGGTNPTLAVCNASPPTAVAPAGSVCSDTTNSRLYITSGGGVWLAEAKSAGGTVNRFPVFTSTNTIGDSLLSFTPQVGGQVMNVSTFFGPSSDGLNFWIGGGGLSSTGGVPSTLGSRNIAIGTNALLSNTTGYNNTAMGVDALKLNTSGFHNVAIGQGSLQSNTTGRDNVAVGGGDLPFGPLASNTTGVANTAMGTDALVFSTTGNSNTALGDQAMEFNQTGSQNVAVGVAALDKNTAGTDNVAIGYQSLFNSQANSDIALGTFALTANTTGTDNIGIGGSSLLACTAGNDNVAIGSQALSHVTTASDNIGLGKTAAVAITTGTFNIALGFNALVSNQTGTQDLALGSLALDHATGNYNIGIGVTSLFDLTSGINNIAIGTGGSGTARGITTGSNNTIIGSNITGLAATTTSKIILADGTGTATDQVWLSPPAPTSVSAGALGTGSSNTVGNITGIGATSVVLTYSNGGFPNRSWCQASPNQSTTIEVIVVTNSATAPTFSCFNSTSGAATNCVDFTYWCTGQ